MAIAALRPLHCRRATLSAPARDRAARLSPPAPASAAPDATAQPIATPAPPPTPPPTVEPITKLLFTGDLIPARCTYAKIMALGGDFTLPFQPLHDMLAVRRHHDRLARLHGVRRRHAVRLHADVQPRRAGRGRRWLHVRRLRRASRTPRTTSRTAASTPAAITRCSRPTRILRAAGIKSAGTGRNLFEARAPADHRAQRRLVRVPRVRRHRAVLPGRRRYAPARRRSIPRRSPRTSRTRASSPTS